MQRLVYLMLILLLAGCAYVRPGKPSCEEITTLRAQIGRELSPELFRAWVAQTYRLPLESITVETRADGQEYAIHWKKHGVWYSASLERRVLVDVRRHGPKAISADRVIACLGEPEWYSAQYKWAIPGHALHCALLFPDQGILAHDAKFLRSRPMQPPPINGHFPISGFVFKQPGSAEQILYQIHGHNSAHYEEVLQEYKPWPGEWEDIVIEIDPSLQQ